MRFLLSFLCLVLPMLLCDAARAEDDNASNADRAGRRAKMRQKMLDKFDADGDGQLSDAERATAREAMRGRRGSRAEGAQGKGSRGKDKKKGSKGGPGRRRQGGPPSPAKLFDKYDANGDGQLSRAEFMKLADHMRAMRKHHRQGGKQRGMRDGRGPRRGPSEDEGSSGRRRPPRPELQ